MRIATFNTNVDLDQNNLPKWFSKIARGHTLVSFTNDGSTPSIIVKMKKNSMKITSNEIGTLGGLSSTAINVIITHDVTFKNGRVESITRNNNNIYELRISCIVHSTRTIPTSTLTSWGMDPSPLPPTSQQPTHQEDTSLPNPAIRQRVNTAGNKKSSHRGNTNQHTDDVQVVPQQQPSVATSTTNAAISTSAPNQEDEDDVMALDSAPVSSRIDGSARVSTSPNVQMDDSAVSASAPEPEEDVNMVAASASTAPNQEPAPAAESSSTEEGTEFNAVTLANNAHSEGLKIAASNLSVEGQVNALFNSFDETMAPSTSGCLENDVMNMCDINEDDVLLQPMDGSSDLLTTTDEWNNYKMLNRTAAVNVAKEGGLKEEIDKVMKDKKTEEGNVWGSTVVDCNEEVDSFKKKRGQATNGAYRGQGLNDIEYKTIADTVCKNISGDSSVSKDEVVKHIPNIMRVLHDVEKEVMQDDDKFKSLPKECQMAICAKLDMNWDGSEDDSSEQDDSSEEEDDGNGGEEEEDGSGSEDIFDRKLLDADNEDEDE